MQACKAGEAHRAHAIDSVSLDKARWFAVSLRQIGTGTDVQRRVRPGGLREVLDGRADAAVALDQQHIARSQASLQSAQVGRRRGAVNMPWLRQKPGQPAAEP